MAFRFRRSVKLGKGIRLNVSKRGVGMSVGTTGFRRSVHSTGRSTSTIGIPGTGLSYVDTKKISAKGKSASGGSSTSVRDVPEKNAVAVEEYHNYMDAITHLHLHNPTTRDWEKMKSIEAPFERNDVGPLEEKAWRRSKQYEPNIFEKFIQPLQNKKKRQLQEDIQSAQDEDARNYEEWEYLHQLAKNVLLGKPETYEHVLKENEELNEAWQRGLLLHVLDAKTIELDVQLSPKEVVPNKTLSLTKTGKVSKRKMGKTKYHALMKDFVCSYVLSLAKETFASVPIEKVIIHVNENVLNTATGHRKKKVLLSIVMDRETLNQLNFEHIVPSDAMDNFEHQMNHLKTKGFRPVNRITIGTDKIS